MTISYDELQDIQDNVEARGQPQDPYASSEIDAQLSQLGPNDHVQLAALLRANPDQQQQILSVAARQCGNACVQRALSMIENGEGAPPSQADRDEVAKDVESSSPVGEAPSAANAADAMQDFTEINGHSAAWNQTADHYNAAHTHHVAEFNAVTDSFAMRDGKIDPEAVSKWQGERGLAPDGKVGPATVAAAKNDADSEKASEPEMAPAPVEEEEDVDNITDANELYKVAE